VVQKRAIYSATKKESDEEKEQYKKENYSPQKKVKGQIKL
jgi:hypothetical protein